MVGVGERPPAADGDEARVAVFRKDHGLRQSTAYLTITVSRYLLPTPGNNSAGATRTRAPSNWLNACRISPNRWWCSEWLSCPSTPAVNRMPVECMNASSDTYWYVNSEVRQGS